MLSDNNAQGEDQNPRGVKEVPKNDGRKYEREIEKEIAKLQIQSKWMN